jgi:hypothetical protein
MKITGALLPSTLIGVCASPDVVCNSIMKPSLILAGSLFIALGLAGTLRTLRRKEEPV